MKKTIEKKRQKFFAAVLSLILAASMILTLIPVSAQKTEGAGYGAYLIWEENGQNKIAYYDSFQDAWNGTFVHGMLIPPTTIGLLKDAHLYRQYYASMGKSLTIELNGHKLFKENNKKHADGALLKFADGKEVRIYGGRRNWVQEGDTVKMPQDPEDKIPGTYFDSNGLAQTTGTESRNTVWNLCYYEWDGDVKYEKNTYSVSGGLITGGWTNDNGGAIQLAGNNTELYLYDTTVAGNIAANNGGGIAMLGNYEKLYLTDSRIAFNNADNDDGGGIFINGNYCRLYMTRSHVDYNLARDNGAGIAVNQNNASISGDAKAMDPSDSEYPANWAESTYTDHPYAKLSGKKNPFWDRVDNSSNRHVSTAGKTSTVAYNVLWKADIDGGGSGIYIDGKNASIAGLNIMKNVARGGSMSGRGAIHLNKDKGTVANSNIWKNWSDSEGGGIFVDEDLCAVTDLTVTENYADTDGWSGGGVYVLGSVNLAIGGKCIIKNNTSQGKKRDDLYLGYNNTMYARINTTLLSDSEVWLWQAGAATKITKTEGTYDDRIYWSDEDGYSIQYFNNILNLVKGQSNEAYRKEKYPEIPVLFLESNASRITEGSRTKLADIENSEYTSESGKKYPLYQGVIEFPSFLNAAQELSSTFFYSDGYFDRNPKNYDSHLATCSMHLAMASFYSNQGNKGGVLYGSEGCEADGTFYPVKSNNIRQFLSDLGVSEANIFLNDFNIQKPREDTIGVAIGSKDITIGDKQKKLVIVGVRGAGYELEWVSNMTLGQSGEAKGFGSAADQVFSELNKYLERKGINGASEDTIFWVAGYSRAGATSNLTGARIIDKFDPNGTHTFVYTFAAPQGGNSDVRNNTQEKYRCIHNIVNASDLVPKVGPSNMGFHRYGVDHYVPGGNAEKTPASKEGSYFEFSNDSASGYRRKKSFTTWQDNQPAAVSDKKKSDYAKQKEKMEKQLRFVAGYDMIFNDYFHAATISYVANKIFGNYGWSMIDTDNSIMTNIPADKRNAAAFSQYFLDDLLEKSVNYVAIEEGEKKIPINGLYRQSYSAVSMEGVPFEKSAGQAAGVLFSMNGKQMEQFTELAGTMMDRIDTTGLYVNFLNAKTNWQAYAIAFKGGTLIGGLLFKLNPYAIVGGGIVAPLGLGIYNAIAGKKSVQAMSAELWSALSKPTEEELKNKKVREKYLEDRARGYLFLQDILTEEQSAKLKESFPALMFVLLGYLKADYKDKGNDMLGTMAYNSSRILSNHYPEVNLSWLRSYDSYYDSQNGIVKLAETDKVKSVKAPEALNVDGVNWGSNVELSGSKPLLTLRVPGDVNSGAAIYYQFREDSAKAPDLKLHPYTGPIQLSLPEGVSEANYFVNVYAIHDGVRSETALIKAHINNNGAFLTYSYPGPSSSVSQNVFMEQGKTYSFEAPVKETQEFKQWTILEGDISGLSGLNLKTRKNTFTAVVPSNCKLQANYFEKSNAAKLTLGEVESGKPLPEKALLTGIKKVSASEYTGFETPVPVDLSWGKIDDTHYRATIKLPFDLEQEFSWIGQKSGEALKSYDKNLKAEVSASPANVIPQGVEGVSVEVKKIMSAEVLPDSSAVVMLEAELQGYVPFSETAEVTVSAWDMNTELPIAFDGTEGAAELKYTAVKGREMTIVIPEAADETFVGIREVSGLDPSLVAVENGVLKVTVPEGAVTDSVSIILNYQPVVNYLDFVVKSAPEAGKPLPVYLGTAATITNSWAITDGISAEWIPQGEPAQYNTAYTLKLTLDKNALQGGMLPEEFASWQEAVAGLNPMPLSGVFVLSDDLVIDVLDETLMDLELQYRTETDEKGNLVVYASFTPTEGLSVKEVISPENAYVDYTEAVDLSVLPQTVSVVLEDDTLDEIPVAWEMDPEYSEPVNPEGYFVHAKGSLSSDKYQLNGFDTVYAYISVLPAFQTAGVSADLTSGESLLAVPEEGEYIVNEEDGQAELIPIEVGAAGTYSVLLHLTSEEGASIAYAITEDGSEPDLGNAWAYEGPVEIGWGDADVVPREKTVRVRAYASKDGKTDSAQTEMIFRLMTVPSIQSTSTGFADRIGVIFETRIPEDIQAETTYATFEVGGKDYEKELRYSYVSSDYKNNIMPFVCEISTLQMADQIFPTIHYVRDGEEKTVIGSPYSLRQEIDETLAIPVTDEDGEKVVALSKALADFGHYSQIYLSEVRNWTLSEDENAAHKPMPLYGEEIDPEEHEAVRKAVESFQFFKRENKTKIKKVRFSLNLETRTEICLYLSMAKDFSGTPTAKLPDGTELTVKKSGQKFKVLLPPYYAAELGTPRTVILSDGSSELEVQVSVLSYVQEVLNSSKASESQKDAVTALYHYYQKLQRFIEE